MKKGLTRSYCSMINWSASWCLRNKLSTDCQGATFSSLMSTKRSTHTTKPNTMNSNLFFRGRKSSGLWSRIWKHKDSTPSRMDLAPSIPNWRKCINSLRREEMPNLSSLTHWTHSLRVSTSVFVLPRKHGRKSTNSQVGRKHWVHSHWYLLFTTTNQHPFTSWTRLMLLLISRMFP